MLANLSIVRISIVYHKRAILTANAMMLTRSQLEELSFRPMSATWIFIVGGKETRQSSGLDPADLLRRGQLVEMADLHLCRIS
jgi:hypothetical protein